MYNMANEKVLMPMQEAKERIHNFSEVTLGYTEEMALEEARRCLGCKNPACVSGCPVHIHIPAFIERVCARDFEGAYEILRASSSLPAVCGRVCPQETQCEARCVRAKKGESVAIGRLERFVADYHNRNAAISVDLPVGNGRRVAVIGSGPSGLTCAGDLARRGYAVTVFEALHTAGGVLVYGIPEFRLPKAIVKQEIDNLTALGVQIMTNVVIGKTMTVDDLMAEGYEAVFIGSGAGLPSFMGIPGESANGVYSANEYLTRANLMRAYREDAPTPIMKGGRVAVIGGGNVAMDAARTALRLGAESVTIVYRRSMEELPARREEVEHAEEEGIVFSLLTAPTEILSYHNPDDPRDPREGFVTGMRCIRMELGAPDERGRRRPVPVADSEFVIDADTVIVAVGTTPNPLIRTTTQGVLFNARGGIVVEEATGLTSREGVYAGGDAVTGAATVISAMGAGRAAAEAIDAYLKAKHTEQSV